MDSLRLLLSGRHDLCKCFKRMETKYFHKTDTKAYNGIIVTFQNICSETTLTLSRGFFFYHNSEPIRVSSFAVVLHTTKNSGGNLHYLCVCYWGGGRAACVLWIDEVKEEWMEVGWSGKVQPSPPKAGVSLLSAQAGQSETQKNTPTDSSTQQRSSGRTMSSYKLCVFKKIKIWYWSQIIYSVVIQSQTSSQLSCENVETLPELLIFTLADLWQVSQK